MQLRTFTVVDALQPQVAGFLGTVCVGDPPLPGQAALLVEVAPGMAVNRLLDVVLKQTACVPGLFMVERRYGVLQLHHHDHGQIREAGEIILSELKMVASDAIAPEVVTAERITGLDPHQSQLVNRMRHGDLQVPGDTLYVLETKPAGIALLAANEAEKAARISIIEFRAVGEFGRVYLGGDDTAIQLAAGAAVASLAGHSSR